MDKKSLIIVIFLSLVVNNHIHAQNHNGFASDVNSGLPVYFPLAKKDFLKMSSAFGSRYHPLQRKVKNHKGLDLVATLGKPVYASACGEVITNDWHEGYGNRIILLHPNGVKTLYGHLMKSAVKVEQEVEGGQIIGLSLIHI